MKEIEHILWSVCMRDRIILSDLSRPANRKTLNVHWYELTGKKQNVGDY